MSAARVLVLTLAIYFGCVIVGMIGGVLLLVGLVSLLAGPEALSVAALNAELPYRAEALLSWDGLALCMALVYVPFAILALWAAVPHPGPTPREYLGLKWPGLRQGLGWGLFLLAADYGYRILVVDGLRIRLLEDDDSFREIASIPWFFPLVFLGIAILFPILEELLFRGFLLEGLRRSKLGEVGAVLITASLWTAMHEGLPARQLGIFLCGCLLAIARLRTGSTYLTVVVHAIVNAVAVFSISSGA